MDVLVYDFETFYDRDYSLSKLTTEEYLRDERYETIGVSVKKNNEPGEWFTGDEADIKLWLHRFDWEHSIGVAHHAQFDASILNWKFGIKPKKIACTLSMARAIDGPDAGNSLAKLAERHGLGVKGNDVISALGMRRHMFQRGHMQDYGRYCVNDGDLCFGLFAKFAPLLPASELNLIDLTIRMFSEPVLELDHGILAEHLAAVQLKKEKLLSRLVGLDRSVLMSNPQLAELLQLLGVDPPKKISRTTGKIAWAFGKTDPGFKDLLDHDDWRVQAVVAARIGVKSTLEETRTIRLMDVATRGALPVPLRYYAAHTGRWGGDGKLNLQNLPRSAAIKKAIKAPKGTKYIDVDSSQIEARTLAWLAGQYSLVQIFEKNNEEIAAGVPKKEMQFDPYRVMASDIYYIAPDQIDDDQRFMGKTTLLGCGYGMGAAKFQMQLKAMGRDLDLEECKRIVNIYRRTYSQIPRLWKQGDKVLQALIDGQTTTYGKVGAVNIDLLGIRLPNGLYIRYDGLRNEPHSNGDARYIYDRVRGKSKVPTDLWGGTVTENVCQALARIIVGEQMLAIRKRYRPVLTVHDAAGIIAPTAEAVQARAFAEGCMRIRPKWAEGLPLNCESKMGASYGG